ncbi:aminoglycoside phosphotransferase family protein [Cryobacterium sp. BB736]|uniref:aminoglycoside phosphotransferase family protein n=1 Tax=Cryobacterium sp. BB736 TaxID=2746963 RepID=UPI001873B0E6
MSTPAADIRVDDALVARLVETQHPDVAGPVTLIANGWDNAIYRLGDRLGVRLPRREVAAQLTLNEQRWLPELAGQVSVPIPVPERIGVPTPAYPWPWSILPWFDGSAATGVPVEDRGRLAVDLAAFVHELHEQAPPDAPHNPVRGVPLRSRETVFLERLATADLPDADRLRRLWERLVETPPWQGPPVWLHGDLHPGNLLVNASGALSAVIDFGDLTAGDPASDLAVAWLAFDPDVRTAFRDLIVDADNDTWLRAHGWALLLSTAFLVHSEPDSAMRAIGEHGLEQVLIDA